MAEHLGGIEASRFYFIIDQYSTRDGKRLHRFGIKNAGVNDWDIVILMETWLKKKKSEEHRKIRESFPD